MSTSGPSGLGGPPGSQAPINQDDGVVTADETFADDALAGQLKQREAKDKKALNDRRAAERARRVQQMRNVQEASAFARQAEQPAADKLQGPQAKTTQEGVDRAREGKTKAGGGLAKQEAKVEELMRDVRTLIEQIDKAGGLEALQIASEASSELEAKTARLLELSAKLERVEVELKDVLRLLLSGGLGFVLAKDPRLTFRRLFARIGRWPKRVPPGRQPESDEEFDEFVAWIFAPPPGEVSPEDLDLLSSR